MAWRRLLTTTTRGFPLPAARLPAHHPSPRRRPFSAVVDASSDDAHDFLDLNQDPVYVHVCPGSRILELALPSDTATLASVDAVWRSKDDPSLQNPRHHQQRYNVGCNILNVASATAMHARVDALASNDAVSVLFFTSRSPDVFSSGLLPDFELTVVFLFLFCFFCLFWIFSFTSLHIPGADDRPQISRNTTNTAKQRRGAVPHRRRRRNRRRDPGRHDRDQQTRRRRRPRRRTFQHPTREEITQAQGHGGGVRRASHRHGVFGLRGGRLPPRHRRHRLFPPRGNNKYVCRHSLFVPSHDQHVFIETRKVRRGLLPVAGAAYRLATCCPEGVALARYLAVTGRALRADELFRCGAHRPHAPAYLIVVSVPLTVCF
jgi:hypothetical protein